MGSLNSPFVTCPIKVVAGPQLEPGAGRPGVDGPDLRQAAPLVPRLEYLDPRTGARGPLLHQPPVPPRALGVVGGQLLVAGIDPATRQRTRSRSTPTTATAGPACRCRRSVHSTPALVVQVLPVPELNTAWLLLGKPARRGSIAATGLWVVSAPVPHLSAAPHQVRSEDPLDSVTGAVGLKDGRLVVIDRGVLTVLSQDGVADVAETSDDRVGRVRVARAAAADRTCWSWRWPCVPTASRRSRPR